MSAHEDIVLYRSDAGRIVIGLDRNGNKDKWKLYVYPEDEGCCYRPYEPITKAELLKMCTSIMDALARKDIP